MVKRAAEPYQGGALSSLLRSLKPVALPARSQDVGLDEEEEEEEEEHEEEEEMDDEDEDGGDGVGEDTNQALLALKGDLDGKWLDKLAAE